MNRCFICGNKAAARANGNIYLCEKHAWEMARKSLSEGNPVIMACQGEPQYMMVPELIKIKAGESSVN